MEEGRREESERDVNVEDGEKGHKSRNIGSLKKLEKGKEQILS